MRTYLDHLPERKQQHIGIIRDLILAEVEKAIGATTGTKPLTEIDYLILFGSYATGSYVEDPVNGYISDYDILLILSRPEMLNQFGLWNSIEDKASRRVNTPVSLIVHSLAEVNQWLNQGQYFFRDIQREGIYLYTRRDKELPNPKRLTPAEKKTIAEKHFSKWIESANRFYQLHHNAFEQSYLNEAAFLLHQATERYFATFLLVVTNYRPKTHDVKRLRATSIKYAEDFANIFPQDTRFHRRCLELLKRAYVDARYSEHYEITTEELSWLAEQVNQLKASVETHCQEYINGLEKPK